MVRRMGRVACSELSGNGGLREMIVTRKGTEFGLRPHLRRMGHGPCNFDAACRAGSAVQPGELLLKFIPELNLHVMLTYGPRAKAEPVSVRVGLSATTCCGRCPRMTQQMG